MKITAAAIIAAASLSLLAAPVSAGTTDPQGWVNSGHWNGPGAGVRHAPEYEFNQNAQDWILSNRNGPRKVFKNEKREFVVKESALEWVDSQHFGGPRIEYR